MSNRMKPLWLFPIKKKLGPNSEGLTSPAIEKGGGRYVYRLPQILASYVTRIVKESQVRIAAQIQSDLNQTI